MLALLIAASSLVAPARVVVVGDAVAAADDGRDRAALRAFAELEALRPTDPDAALWQLAVVALTMRVDTHARADAEIEALGARLEAAPQDRRADVARLAIAVVRARVTELYALGPGCFAPSAWSAPHADAAPRLLARVSSDAAEIAFAHFVVGELHASAQN